MTFWTAVTVLYVVLGLATVAMATREWLRARRVLAAKRRYGESRDEQRAVAIARLTTTLERFPSLRIGQLIVNATNRTDPFYLTDENLAKALDDYTRMWGR